MGADLNADHTQARLYPTPVVKPIAAASSNRNDHDFRAWCRKCESTNHRQLENHATKRDFGPKMARPGLEPGTPRFSVVRP